ncbi:MAG: hypothetical protein ABIG31_04355 [Candidatus Omnitrophota bacterium]
MTKEEALNEFLKGLRIVLNNASAYPKDHPYFVQSVDTFRGKLVALLPFLSPVRMDIAASSLFMDGKHLEKGMLYADLASLLHLRKIKSIEFRQGLTNQELVEFLSCVSLPLKEVLRQGGIRGILNQDKSSHIHVEELDYSQLLRDEGEEVKDIWVYLFRAVIQNKDLAKINSFAQNFEQIIHKFSLRDLTEDAELIENLHNFLSYLKGADQGKFHFCSKNLFKLFLGGRDIPQEEKLEKIKAFFQDLPNEDLVDVLIESISQSDNFNNLSFNVFARLFDQARHRELALELESRIKNSKSSKISPKFRKKVKEIFSVPRDSYVLPLYRRALEGLWQDETAVAQWSFDHPCLQTHYGLLLLNLLAQEKDIEVLGLVAERLLKDCLCLTKERNWEFLRSLVGLLDQKCKQDSHSASALEKLREYINQWIENMAFEEVPPQELQYFLNTLDKSSLGLEVYLKKIFEEKRINPYVLKLLLNIFPDDLASFYENLERKKSDMEFLEKIVKGLQGAESPLSLGILKRIFAFSNNIIRLEVLKSMQSIPSFDKEFLLSLFKKEDARLKGEAFLILARDERARKEALKELFTFLNPLGFKNKILLENMTILEEVEGVELKEAKEHLVLLSKRPFFWNKNVREKAAEVLRRIDVR